MDEKRTYSVAAVGFSAFGFALSDPSSGPLLYWSKIFSDPFVPVDQSSPLSTWKKYCVGERRVSPRRNEDGGKTYVVALDDLLDLHVRQEAVERLLVLLGVVGDGALEVDVVKGQSDLVFQAPETCSREDESVH